MNDYVKVSVTTCEAFLGNKRLLPSWLSSAIFPPSFYTFEFICPHIYNKENKKYCFSIAILIIINVAMIMGNDNDTVMLSKTKFVFKISTCNKY